jgi:hypothetical protein
MILLRFKTPVLLLIFAMTVVSTHAQPHDEQQQEPSAEIRGQLFKQVLADFPDLRECIEQGEGGVRAAQENMTVETVDVNHDGVPEYEVQMSGACACGMVNCSIYIYRKTAQGFESLLDDASGMGLELLKTSSNGYSDLLVEARDTAATRAETIYKFDGKHYREGKTTIVQMETGERKPASRRLQFKRGMSWTTVTGKVSIALPDTFLVGARAGQVMTIKLTAPRKSVRFLLMSPTTRNLVADNAREWTGTLPETGDYYIIVDADERGSTYSMTVTIK